MIINKVYRWAKKKDLEAELAAGLAGGLVMGLVWGLATFPFMNFPENLIMVLLILALSELLFLLDKRQPRKENRFWFTAKVKGEALLESVIIFFNCYVLYRVDWKGVYEAVSGSSDTIWSIICFIGWGTLIIGAIAGLIWFNSLRYKEAKKMEDL